MTRGDQAVETAADRLETLVKTARSSGGVKAKVGEALAEDPDFLRKLKPSLIAARAKGANPVEPPRSPNGAAPEPQDSPPPPKTSRRGPNPWLVVGVALAIGYVLAKVIDWRGHAHPHL